MKRFPQRRKRRFIGFQPGIKTICNSSQLSPNSRAGKITPKQSIKLDLYDPDCESFEVDPWI